MTIRQVTPALKKKAEKEINENAKRLPDDLRAFRDWLKKQPHLHLVQPSDQWLLAFLRGGKFSLERCKEKFEMYYTMKTIVPELFWDRDPMDPKIQNILKLGIFLPLRKCNKADSPRVCFMRLGAPGAAQCVLTDLIKVALMTTEILMLEDDNFTIAGEEVVVDMKDIGVSTMSQWTPALAKKTITCFEKAMPIRVRGTHFLNIPSAFEALYSVFKMFLGDKIKKRLHVHKKDYKGLYKVVPKTILPAEYGGEDGTIQDLTEHWKAKIESYRDWFVQEENVKSDESSRADNIPKNSAIVFGVEGSFRKLEVD